MTLVATAGFIVGYGLSYTNNAIPVINAVFGWNTEDEQNLNDALINTAFSFGAMFGSSNGGRFISKGRRMTMFLASGIGITGCLISSF
jgi:MFS family permease